MVGLVKLLGDGVQHLFCPVLTVRWCSQLPPKFEKYDTVWLKVPRKPAAEVTITDSRQDGVTGRWSYRVEDKAGRQVNLQDYTTEPQWFSEISLSNNEWRTLNDWIGNVMETLSLRSSWEGKLVSQSLWPFLSLLYEADGGSVYRSQQRAHLREICRVQTIMNISLLP